MESDAKSVNELITRLYTRLTRSQRLLADYVLQYTAEAALMSSKEIADELSVSEATVVRFAQQLGFDGYPQFRQRLQRQLLRDIRSSERVASLLHEEEAMAGPLQQMVALTVQQVQLLTQNVSEREIAKVVGAINSARAITIFGEGALAAPTVQLGFWLNRLGCQVRVINQTGRRFFEDIILVDPKDVGIVFSFRRVGPEATALLEHFHENQADTVLLTDVANSPVHDLATTILKVYRGPMGTFRPLGAVSSVCDAIILGVMLAKGEAGVETLQQLDDLRQRYGFL